MIPLRILLVEDALPALQDLRQVLEETGEFEISCATSSPAGMLGLARTRPDLLVLNPYAGRGSIEAWRRAVGRYRQHHPLGLLALAHRIPPRDQDSLQEMADLGIFSPGVEARRIQAILEEWADSERLLAGAAPETSR